MALAIWLRRIVTATAPTATANALTTFAPKVRGTMGAPTALRPSSKATRNSPPALNRIRYRS